MTTAPEKDLAAIAAELWTRLEAVELVGGWDDDRPEGKRLRGVAQAQLMGYLGPRLMSTARGLAPALRGKYPEDGTHAIDAAAAAINEHLRELLWLVVDAGPEARECSVKTYYSDGYWFPRSTT